MENGAPKGANEFLWSKGLKKFSLMLFLKDFLKKLI